MNRENFEQIELRIERCLPCAVLSCLELNKQMGSKLVKGEILWRRTESVANKTLERLTSTLGKSIKFLKEGNQ